MVSQKTRDKISEGLKKAHREGRHPGWKHINENSNISYPERFLKKLMNNLYQNHLILEHFSFGKYFLDFAFIDIKLDLELDGQQHFRTEQARKKDKEREKFLELNGWKIYRIAWLELFNYPEKTINEFFDWLKNYSNSLSRKYNYKEIIYLKKKHHIYGDRKSYSIARKNKNDIKAKPLIDAILNSEINFTKHGWKTKVAKLIGISPQKVPQWMNRNMKVFYLDKCTGITPRYERGEV